jgi:hypothetical protein
LLSLHKGKYVPGPGAFSQRIRVFHHLRRSSALLAGKLSQELSESWAYAFQFFNVINRKYPQGLFALFRHMNLDSATIVRIRFPDHEPEFRQSIDKFDSRMMPDEQTLSNLADTEPVSPWRPFDGKKGLMLLWSQASLRRSSLTEG